MEPSAFKTCFETSRAPLLAYLVRASGNPDLAEEVLQEAYVRLLNASPRDLRPEALRGWLLTTATRLLRDHWRRHRRLQWWPWGSDEGDEPGPAEPVSPEPPADLRAQERQLVAHGFSRLSPRQRSLLWLAYVEGLDHAELARALGLGQGSVKVLLHRARQRMQGALLELENPFFGGGS
ncbi:RNA polymerase sigma24 factor [Geothrix oryzae]|uniref:RNA polymerase sigma24 factor n=1 Tax=Geothrix oryzae TaxID=2927975 RepID=A0ABN6V2H1_9BACT|nr:RNA polymerase sigma factor [Geothrix oryzae]BDU70585.1 RNA polymerase sigma24 factor [Geothrix oryzae]